MNRICGNITRFDVDRLKKHGECAYLIRFRINCHLPQHNSGLNRPSTNHPQCWHVIGCIYRASRYFTINRNLLSREIRKCRVYPGKKARLKHFRTNTRKNTTNRIMRRNTIWQCKKRPKPIKLSFRDGNYFRGAICSTDDSTDGKHKNIDEQVLFIPIEPNIFNIIKIFDECGLR